MGEEEIRHDFSRVDAYARTRQRVSLLDASWKPVLAGAAGAVTIIGAAAFGAWVAGPRFRYAEIEVPKITMREVTADHVVPRTIEVEVDHVKPKTVEIDVPRVVTHQVDIDTPHVVPHETVIEIPRVVTPPPIAAPAPVASAPPLTPPTTPPRTPEEFKSSPTYRAAEVKGRVIASVDGRALSFEGNNNFWPAHADPVTGEAVVDPQNAFDADQFVGDLGMCVQDKADKLWSCTAFHNGRPTPVTYKQGRPL